MSKNWFTSNDFSLILINSINENQLQTKYENSSFFQKIEKKNYIFQKKKFFFALSYCHYIVTILSRQYCHVGCHDNIVTMSKQWTVQWRPNLNANINHNSIVSYISTTTLIVLLARFLWYRKNYCVGQKSRCACLPYFL